MVADLKTGTSDYSIKPQSFTTAPAAPRFIYCAGITNMRDAGGWESSLGGRIRQGLLYRCGRLNSSNTENVTLNITAEGMDTMKKLGIRSEIDLRRTDNGEVGGIKESVLPGVQYYPCPMSAETGFLHEETEMLKNVIGILADEANYPIIYHCNIGTDRTGYVAYVVGALLGMSEEDLARDYLLSNFASIGSSRKLTRVEDDYIVVIKAYPGETMAEKAESYLLDIGVLPEEIAEIRRILLEK